MSTIKANTVQPTTTNANLNLNPDGSGAVIVDGLTFPTADGSANQYLKTDGSGNLDWVDAPAASGWSFVSDTALTAVNDITYSSLTATSQYQFVLSGIYPSTAGAELGVQFYWSGSYPTGVYSYNFVYSGTDGDVESGGPNGGYIPIGPDLKNSGPHNVMGIVTFAGLESGTNAFIAYNCHVYDNSASFYGHVTGVGRQAATAEVTGIRFILSGGANYAASGKIKMYERAGV
tara:strand:+ start:485 stop:1180 length:696 start_codon:yes stop_codon:yes gene_type:complete